jgi:hypothetical protein
MFQVEDEQIHALRQQLPGTQREQIATFLQCALSRFSSTPQKLLAAPTQPSSSAAPTPLSMIANDAARIAPLHLLHDPTKLEEEGMSHTIPQLASIFSRTPIGRKTVGITLRGRERRTIHGK